MIDLLKRTLAPVTAEAWKEIDETAVRALKTSLSARTLVDFEGPHGWDFAAVNVGRLEIAERAADDPPWAVRSVLPLIEVRDPVKLKQMELDVISRGAKDADLRPVEDSARRVALFEDRAVYNGFPAGKIEGMLPRSSHEPVSLPGESAQYPAAVAAAIEKIHGCGIAGP